MHARLLCFLILSVSANLSAQNLDLITTLDDGITESSGLIFINDKVISHNDSGGENALLEIDTATGNVSRTVYIANAVNRDWEDICNDSDYIYLADFGNNNGNRTDLAVYKISISDYFNTANDTIFADTIAYSYLDQVDFVSGTNNTNFDAEAIISYDSLLYIFSKNWLDSKCNIYALSKIPGTYAIAKVDSFDSQGLITGACYNTATNTILLTGYGPPIPFVIRIEHVSSVPFSNHYRIHNFIQVANGTSVQIEATCPIDQDTYFISSEQSVLGNAMLSKLDINELLSVQDLGLASRQSFPNPSKGVIQINIEEDEYIKIYDLSGKLLTESKESHINVNSLKKATYMAIIYSPNGIPIAQARFVVH